MNKRLNNIRTLFLKLFPIQIFVFMSSTLSNVINGLIVGNYLPAASMTGLGLVTPVINIISSLSMIVSGGAGILCGNYMGKGETDKVNKVYSISMQMLAVTGLILSVGVFVTAEPLAQFLKASTDAFPETVAYLRGLSASILPMMVMPCLMTFLQMCNKSKVSLAAMIALGVLSAVFGLLNVHVVHMGIFGIGISTTLSRYIVVIGMIALIATKKEMLSYQKGSFDMKMAKDIVIYGSPGAVANLLYSVRNVFLNTYALKVGGDVAVNALAILGSCGGFFDALNVGVQNTLTMVASVFIGERDSESVNASMQMSLIAGMALCAVRALVAVPFAPQIAQLFGAEGAVIASASSLLRFYTLSAPFNIITVTIMAVYQGLGRARFCNIVYLFHCIGTPLFCCIVLTKIFGINGIWISYTMSELVTICLFLIKTVIQKKKFPVTLLDIADLPKEFDTANKYMISINTMDQVVEVSKKIESFCREQGIDAHRSMLAGLCMEEMAGDIVEHGFPKSKGPHTVDIFACVENNDVLMRLRDNCVPFDPHSRLALFNPENPEKYLGIRMVSGISKEMKYQANFGMNVLTITI